MRQYYPLTSIDIFAIQQPSIRMSLDEPFKKGFLLIKQHENHETGAPF